MNKIINGRATVAVYISTVTVARVEIYTFLHNFRRTDVELSFQCGTREFKPKARLGNQAKNAKAKGKNS